MRETETQMLITVFGGQPLLARALGIESHPLEDQTPILEHFCEYVFKKVLLDVPEGEMGKVIDLFEEHRASVRSLDTLIDGLRAIVPGLDGYIHDEIVRSVTDFRGEGG